MPFNLTPATPMAGAPLASANSGPARAGSLATAPSNAPYLPRTGNAGTPAGTMPGGPAAIFGSPGLPQAQPAGSAGLVPNTTLPGTVGFAEPGMPNGLNPQANQYDLLTGKAMKGGPAIEATLPYQDYTNYGTLANQWGQTGAGVFSSPVGQTVSQSIGALGQAGAGNLPSQQVANAGLAGLGTSAAGQTMPEQQAMGAAQTLGNTFATGQAPGQQMAQAWLQGGIGNAYQNANLQTAGGLSGQQNALAAAQGIAPFTTGDAASQLQNQGSIDLLRSAAMGQQPSAAQQAMSAGNEQAVAQQMAMANSARGEFGLANAQRQAQQTGAAMQQQNVQQQGILRAQEMAQAQQALQGATSANVGQQLGAQTAATNAFQQQANLQAQGVQQMGAMGAAGTQAANEQAAQQLQAQTAAGQQYGQEAQLQAQAQQAYLGGAAQLSQQQINALAQYNQAAGSEQNTMLGFANTQQANALGQAELAGNLALGQGNLTLGQAAQAMQQNIANQQQQQQYIGAALGAGGAILGGLIGGPAGAAAGGSAGYAVGSGASDERVKTDIDRLDSGRAVGHEAADRMLGKIEPHTFRYSSPEYEPNPDGAGGKYLGVMAQELERSPEGRQLVERGPDGVRRINTPAAVGALLGAASHLHRRIGALEAAR